MMRHDEFAACLLQEACPPGLHLGQPIRLNALRCIATTSRYHLSILADGPFPVTLALVGDAFFGRWRVCSRAAIQSPLRWCFMANVFPDFISRAFNPPPACLSGDLTVEMAFT
jgi:hypothetical protein